MMAGGTFAGAQPGGAFGLQILRGPLDRLLNLLSGGCGNRGWLLGQGETGEAKSQQEHREGGGARHGSVPGSNDDRANRASILLGYQLRGLSANLWSISSQFLVVAALSRAW
ncbi:MAG: hypothetical protein K8R36_05480 [Planctomycetales bacterium]|nr:hypothetical protein [Planctomycetales bacterium]